MTPGTPPTPAPRTTRLTGRAAVLAVVICAIALSLAYPVREYMAQRGQIAQLVAQQQAVLAQVQALQEQHAKLADPAYIEQVARQQLDMCFPGAKCYIIEGGGQTPVTASPAHRAVVEPWYGKLWRSVRQADASPAK
jgi:cell division protein FtsL